MERDLSRMKTVTFTINPKAVLLTAEEKNIKKLPSNPASKLPSKSLRKQRNCQKWN